MQILVLYGGCSPERAVSVCSAQAVLGALAKTSHHTVAIDYRGVLDPLLLSTAKTADAVFLTLHGGEEEGGVLQAQLEQNGIFHYTGAAPAAAALALDKARAKAVAAGKGIPVAKSTVWQAGDAPPAFPTPAVLKPLCGGSSVGVCMLKSKSDLSACRPTTAMLLEEYLSGREYSIGILHKKALPVVELRPKNGFYDYHNKYTPGATDELCPAPLTQQQTEALQQMALTAFEALGLRDVARIDFKENDDGVPCFLEANTLPGLTATSLLPLAARAAGIAFPTLCEELLTLAATRKQPT